MRVPRHYRLALRAYPAPYRRSRGPELATTLADGDDDRGRASTREALALAGRGLAMRAGVAVSGPGLLAAAATLLAFPLALGVFGEVGRIFVGVPDLASVVEVAKWLPAIAVDQWLEFVLATVAAVSGAWVVLKALERLGPLARRRTLAATMVVLSGIALGQAWSRPEDPGTFGIYEGEYVHGQFAQLGAASLLAALGVLLALVALWRLRPR